MSAGAERVATGQLADQLERTVLGQGEPWDYVREAAARLRELEALEPVRRLLAAMETADRQVVLSLGSGGFDPRWWAQWDAGMYQGPEKRVVAGGKGDTPEAALRALADAVGEGGRA